MKFLFLKYCYAVELGAHLAYLGHFRATDDQEILKIAHDEYTHMRTIETILAQYDHKPNPFMNFVMRLVGNTIRSTCRISPKLAMNLIAEFLEKINVFNYGYMARQFPEHNDAFVEMLYAEERHAVYFKSIRHD